MIIPIRCFTCGKVIANKWEEFRKRIESGEDPNKVLKSLGFDRYCCKRMLISHIELIDELLLYNEPIQEEINSGSVRKRTRRTKE